MKNLTLVLLLVLLFAAAIAAQSGRKLKTTPQAAATPEVSATRDRDDSQVSVGYSESAPNAPRTIIPRSREKKRGKDDRKSAAVPSTAVPTPAPGDEEVIKVETNLITVPVSVSDRSGIYVSNLNKSNFKIFEDGKEQDVAFFGTSENPFTVILLIDVSPSTSYKIEEIQAAAVSFVDQLKPADNVMVIQFDRSVSVLTELTNDRQKIYKAIRRTGFGDGTSLYEAVDFSLRKRLNKIEGRKAIVLFTDGVDTSSNRATFESTLNEAEESEALVFPIYYNTFLSTIGIGTGGVMSTPPTLGIPGGGQNTAAISADYSKGRAYLTELAAVTGGRVFRAESTPGGLESAFEGIAEELSRQYSIGYFPQTEGEPGQRKQIKVRVDRPNLVIRSRDSYIVGEHSPTNAPEK
ncbi:MAG: VWA domain-containing protein [Acidobacteriota bacterium]